MVSVGYNEIRNDVQNLSNSSMEKLLNYFEKQWLVDIDLWNVSNTDTRTNNTCEGERKTNIVLIITSTYCH